MNGRSVRKGPAEILCIVMGVLLAAFFAGEMALYAKEAPTLRLTLQSAGFAGLAALFFLVLRRSPDTIPGRNLFRSDGRNLALLAAGAVIPRILWLAAVPPQVISDYGLYVRLAGEFAASGTVGRDAYLLTVAPAAPAFAAVLGLVMRVSGTGEGTAVGFCLAVNILNIGLLYLAGRKLLSAPRAFAAAAVFALLPENVFYSTLPGSESVALLTLLAGVLLLLSGRDRKGTKALPFWLGGGLLLAFSACIRANAWAAVLAAAVCLPGDSGEPRSRRLIRLAALGAAAVLGLAGQQAFRNRVFGGEKAAGGLGWTLYEGLDLENGGKWTEEKSARCIEVISAFPPEEADRIFLREGLERYRGYTAAEKAKLFLRKGGSLWYESRYSLISAEGKDGFPALNDLAALGWCACLALLTACLLRRLRHPVPAARREGCVFCLIILLATTLWHEAGTSIGRYHYMLIPFALLTVFQLLPGAAGRAGKEEKP